MITARLLAAVVSIGLAACSSGSAHLASKPEAPIAAAPARATGTVRTAKLTSAALGVVKRYVVYLPAGYETSTQRYPVFYYLHGLGGNETNWTDNAKLHDAADALGLQAIVVMPDGDDAFYANGLGAVDYDKCIADGTGMFLPGHERNRHSCVKKRDYDTYITQDLIAHVDTTYRTIATRAGRAIAGVSMGGFGALQLSFRHPELYAAAASHSGLVALLYAGPIPYQTGKVELLTDVKTWGGPFVDFTRWMIGLFGEDIAQWRKHDPTALVASLSPSSQPALYIDCGTEDALLLHNQAAYLHDLLLARQIEHEYFLGPGGHDFRFWRQRIGESLRFLRDRVAKPN